MNKAFIVEMSLELLSLAGHFLGNKHKKEEEYERKLLIHRRINKWEIPLGIEEVVTCEL